MKRNTTAPIEVERSFGVNELFFSVTDKKGIIESGNNVFVRISGYGEQELVGRPHNIIRHPDMPRAVFKLLWDYLDAGKVISAYVKNMAKDGAYYWVVALVSPLKNGYVSVRFKPMSALFEVVQQVYKELREIELQHEDGADGWRAGMHAAEKRLLEILNSKGFSNYDSFMQAFLREELKSRATLLEQTSSLLDQENEYQLRMARESKPQLSGLYEYCMQLDKNLKSLFHKLDGLVSLNSSLHDKSDFVSSLGAAIRLLSLNANVESSRLGDSGRTLGIISQFMEGGSREVSGNVDGLSQNLVSIGNDIRLVLFELASAELQVEMINYFLRELILTSKVDSDDLTSTPKLRQTIEQLREAVNDTCTRIFQALSRLRVVLQLLEGDIYELGKSVYNLHFVHLNGMIEAARFHGASGFDVILRSAAEQIEEATSNLSQLRLNISTIQRGLEGMEDASSRINSIIEEVSTHIASGF